MRWPRTDLHRCAGHFEMCALRPNHRPRGCWWGVGGWAPNTFAALGALLFCGLSRPPLGNEVERGSAPEGPGPARPPPPAPPCPAEQYTKATCQTPRPPQEAHRGGTERRSPNRFGSEHLCQGARPGPGACLTLLFGGGGAMASAEGPGRALPEAEERRQWREYEPLRPRHGGLYIVHRG